jgi:hypothetical protein
MRSGNGRTKAAEASATGARRTEPRAPSPDDRRELIRRTAYFLSERCGFDPSRDIENWLEAERQVDAGLARPGSRARTYRKSDAQVPDASR